MEEKVNKGTSEKGDVRNEKEGREKGRKGRRRARGERKEYMMEKKGKLLPNFSQGILKCNVLQC